MPNIITYIGQYGDKDFQQLAFNEVDSAILCHMSYLYFDDSDIYSSDFKKSLLDTYIQDYHEDLFKQVYRREYHAETFQMAARSKRFGGIRLGNYINKVDKSVEKQFATITYKLSDQLYYIAFRGTDDSLVGWKDSMNLAFLEDGPSQVEALDFVNKSLENLEGNFILGGHSKGGNLAVYSFLKLDEDCQDRILSVYNHDGPGFLESSYDQEVFDRLSGKIKKTIPKGSIVGLLLERNQDYKIVDSSAFLAQHELFTWQVEGDRFVELERLSPISINALQALDEWLEDIDFETRKLFIDTVYDIFDKADIDNFSQSKSYGMDKVLDFIKQYARANPQIKKEIYGKIYDLAKIFISQVKRKALKNDKNSSTK